MLGVIRAPVTTAMMDDDPLGNWTLLAAPRENGSTEENRLVLGLILEYNPSSFSKLYMTV